MPDYAIVLLPLADEEGGGWRAEVPDLPGCASDGNDKFEALTNVADAIDSWIEEAKDQGRPIPEAEWQWLPTQRTKPYGKEVW